MLWPLAGAIIGIVIGIMLGGDMWDCIMTGMICTMIAILLSSGWSGRKDS
jgi:hypothetical protein